MATCKTICQLRICAYKWMALQQPNVHKHDLVPRGIHIDRIRARERESQRLRAFEVWNVLFFFFHLSTLFAFLFFAFFPSLLFSSGFFFRCRRRRWCCLVSLSQSRSDSISIFSNSFFFLSFVQFRVLDNKARRDETIEYIFYYRFWLCEIKSAHRIATKELITIKCYSI